MVGIKLKDLNPEKLSKAQGVLELFECMGITEDMLDEIKNLPQMKKELAELREFRARVIDSQNISSQEKIIKNVFGGKVEEFNPDGKGN